MSEADEAKIKEKLILILTELFSDREVDSEVMAHADLIDDLGMDSLLFMSMLVEVEDSFDIIIPDEQLYMEHFRSVDHIVSIVADASEQKGK